MVSLAINNAHDPRIISDEQMIKWGQEAMKKGTVNGQGKLQTFFQHYTKH